MPGPPSPMPSLSHPPSRDPRKITLALAACMALQMTSLVMILPLFARRLRDFGAEVDALGQGGWSDRVGRKPILILGLVLFTAQFGGLVVLLTP